MSFGGLILTNAGRNRIAAAVSEKKPLQFTQIQLGDGVYKGSYLSKTELTNKIMEIPVTSVVRKDNEVIISCDWNSKQAPEGFYLREIGIIGNGMLCYYDNAGNGDTEYIDPESEVMVRQKRFRFTISVADDVEITTAIASGLYALEEDLNALDQEVETLQNTMNSHAGNSALHSDTKNTAGATDTSDKLYLVGSPDQSANPQTYSQDTAYIGTDGCLYSDGKIVATKEQLDSLVDAIYQQATAYADQIKSDIYGGTPSATLDTIAEIAEALENNDDVVSVIAEELGKKAAQAELDTHTGNDTIHITTTERTQWNDANNKKHSHSNKSILEKITQALFDKWNSAYDHISDAVKHITNDERRLWNTVSDKVDQADFDSLEIGGRNLLVGSATHNFAEAAAAGTYNYSVFDDNSVLSKKIIKIECVGSGMGFFSRIGGDVPGTTYTYSFWAKCSVAKSGNIGYERGGQFNISLTTEWKYFKHTFTATNNQYSSFSWYLNWEAGEILYIHSFKLEEGNKPTDWTPAPEDKADVGHTHDDYLPLTGGTVTGLSSFTDGLKVSGRISNSGDDEGLLIERAPNGFAGIILGTPTGIRSVFYLNNGDKALWRYNDGETSHDIFHPAKSGIIALTSDIPTALPADGGTSEYADRVWTQSHRGSWYINSNWDGTYRCFVTNAKETTGHELPIKVDNSGHADSADMNIVCRVEKSSQSLPGVNRFRVEEYVPGADYDLPSNDWYHIYTAEGQDANYATQLALGMRTSGAYYRRYTNKKWSIWHSLINTDTTNFLPLSGGVMSGDIDFQGDANKNYRTLLRGKNGDDDWFWEIVGSNSGLNLYTKSTESDGTCKPIKIIQQLNAFSENEATLLDEWGITRFDNLKVYELSVEAGTASKYIAAPFLSGTEKIREIGAIKISGCAGAIIPGWRDNNDGFVPANGMMSIGSSSYRFDTVWSSKSDLNGSDRFIKEQIKSMTAGEDEKCDKYMDLFDSIDICTFKYRDLNKMEDSLNPFLYEPNRRRHTGVLGQELEDDVVNARLNEYDFAAVCTDFFAPPDRKRAAIFGGYQAPKVVDGTEYSYSDNTYNYKHAGDGTASEDYVWFNEILDKDIADIEMDDWRTNIQYLMIEDNSKLTKNQPPVIINSITLVDMDDNYVDVPLDLGYVANYEWDDENYENPRSSCELLENGSLKVNFDMMYGNVFLKIAEESIDITKYKRILFDIDYISEYKMILIPKGNYTTANIWDRVRQDKILYNYSVRYQEIHNLTTYALQKTRKEFTAYREETDRKMAEQADQIRELSDMVKQLLEKK